MGSPVKKERENATHRLCERADRLCNSTEVTILRQVDLFLSVKEDGYSLNITL